MSTLPSVYATCIQPVLQVFAEKSRGMALSGSFPIADENTASRDKPIRTPFPCVSLQLQLRDGSKPTMHTLFSLEKYQDIERRMAIFETNYGREAGWFVECKGRRIAQLTDPRFEDMFWESYIIEPLIEDPAERALLLESPEQWISCDFVYRNRQFDEVAENAISALSPFPEPGRVIMRGLYLTIEAPGFLERCLVAWHKKVQMR